VLVDGGDKMGGSIRYGWSLDNIEWERLQNFPLDAAWKRVPFTPLAFNDIADKPGVYMVTARVPGTGQWNVPEKQNPIRSALSPLYIGMSRTSMRDRFRSHHNEPTWRMEQAKGCFKNADLEYWFLTLDPDQVAPVEKVLITAFGPPVNSRNGITEGKTVIGTLGVQEYL